ncbi:MAG: hypothetical protein ABFC34_13260 [Methanobacterium sp.]
MGTRERLEFVELPEEWEYLRFYKFSPSLLHLQEGLVTFSPNQLQIVLLQQRALDYFHHKT